MNVDIQKNKSKKTKHQMNVELFTHVNLTWMTFPQFIRVYLTSVCMGRNFVLVRYFLRKLCSTQLRREDFQDTNGKKKINVSNFMFLDFDIFTFMKL